MFCAAVVYLMIIVGGITRLTQSGLSMVEWAPIMGALPPIGEAAWQQVFEKYKEFPEYQKVNLGMTLAEFKGIFWWEYGHRVLGRVIGLIYFLPLMFFVAKGMVPYGWRLRLLGLFILGGLQGLMGWYMVKSGLVDVPHVSQYRLVAHLGLALVIFICMFWYGLDFLFSDQPRALIRDSSLYRALTTLSVVLVFCMMLSGGFVAGTKAGFIINTFPMMNGEWVPGSLVSMSPWWRNVFENTILIQFIHRWFAIIVLLAILAMFVCSLKQSFKTYAIVVLVFAVAQVLLGITALVMRVPVAVGAAHQATAVALLASCLLVAHRARKHS